VVTDQVGNAATVTAGAADEVDTTAPTASVAPAVTGWTTQTSDQITVTAADAGSGVKSVELFDGKTDLGAAHDNGDGTWSLTAQNLGDGGHTFSAVVTDQVGNAATVTAGAADEVDTTAPTASVAESVSGWTKQSSDVITVTAADGGSGVNKVEILDNGQHLGWATLANGAWSYTASSLQNGTSHSFTAVVTDNAGNVTTPISAGAAVQVDTVTPTATVTESVSGWTKQSSDLITVTATDTGSGVNTVEILDNGQHLGWATLANGAWSYTAAGLQNGTSHSFTAVITDKAGNATAQLSAGAAVQVDTVVPTATVTEAVSGWTKQTSDVITVTASDGGSGVNTVEILDNGQHLGWATLANGAWSYAASALQNGTHSFSAVVTDKAGNATAQISAGAAVNVDTTPATTTIGEAASGWTNHTSDVISGTAADGAGSGVKSVEVYDNGHDVGAAKLNADGTWSYTASGLQNGTTHSFTAVVTDNVGNASPAYSAGPAVMIDLVAPTVSVTKENVSQGNQKNATIVFNGADNSGGSGINHYVYWVDNSSHDSAIPGSGTSTLGASSTSVTLSYQTVNGQYFHIAAVDNAGNTSLFSDWHIV
jgi:hypothetical protein